jgi:hypothetical protein
MNVKNADVAFSGTREPSEFVEFRVIPKFKPAILQRNISVNGCMVSLFIECEYISLCYGADDVIPTFS